MKTFKWMFFIFALSGNLSATQYEPWLGSFYEFELRSNLIYQGFSNLSSGSHLKKYHSDDLFLTFSLSNAIPDPDIGLELEIAAARTRKQRAGKIDQLKLNGRWSILDDLAGDVVSLTLGGSYIQAFRKSLRDPACFHHGLFNGELFISLGRELEAKGSWLYRWYAVTALGFAEKGSPWLRLNANFEKHLCECHEAGLFVHSLWGMGKKNLSRKHFRGYGDIDHQSIDLGLRYRYLIDFFGSASIEYSYRVYARNFPIGVHRALIQVLYTFGL